MSDYWCVVLVFGKPFITLLREHAKKAEAVVDKWDNKGIAYRFVLVFVVFCGAMTAGCNLPSVPVIIVCQIVNGVLLPFLGTLLLLCINDNKLMANQPQTRFLNICLISAVSFTVFLAAVGLLDKVYDLMLPAADEVGKDDLQREEDAFEKDETVIFLGAMFVTATFFVWVVWKLWKEKGADSSYRAISRKEEYNENPIQDTFNEASEAVAVVVGGYGAVGGGGGREEDPHGDL